MDEPIDWRIERLKEVLLSPYSSDWEKSQAQDRIDALQIIANANESVETVKTVKR